MELWGIIKKMINLIPVIEVSKKIPVSANKIEFHPQMINSSLKLQRRLIFKETR